ncbi:VOC family protein [Phenylobacterium sp. J367]|uniref:VOC family protein n=1 Tax=Phenylobacterium sp. J367 TaxID=2898435 RepID=UPI0021514B85|nr:VOC family protein [Phenylobacterium sp. J367]MCR5880227.1 VOC family protein [Phenylobacterium sp. J367]
MRTQIMRLSQSNQFYGGDTVMAAKDIRHTRLGYVALNVSDIKASEAFYGAIVGLTASADSTEDVVFFRCSDRHHDLMLCQDGNDHGLKRVGWELESPETVDIARFHFQSLGLPIVEVPDDEAARLGIDFGFRTVYDKLGAVFEYYSAMNKAAPAFTPTHTKIARLGHVVLNTPHHREVEDFLLNQMNFRASDRVDGMVTFMRCFPNPFHHSLGLSAGQAQRLNHVNFMVTEIDDIGRAMNRMKANDVKIVYGPGRHPPSESIFLYFLDPDGITVEYSFGMEEFPEIGPRNPRLLEAKLESVDFWGGLPQPGFGNSGMFQSLQSQAT